MNKQLESRLILTIVLIIAFHLNKSGANEIPATNQPTILHVNETIADTFAPTKNPINFKFHNKKLESIEIKREIIESSSISEQDDTHQHTSLLERIAHHLLTNKHANLSQHLSRNESLSLISNYVILNENKTGDSNLTLQLLNNKTSDKNTKDSLAEASNTISLIKLANSTQEFNASQVLLDNYDSNLKISLNKTKLEENFDKLLPFNKINEKQLGNQSFSLEIKNDSHPIENISEIFNKEAQIADNSSFSSPSFSSLAQDTYTTQILEQKFNSTLIEADIEKLNMSNNEVTSESNNLTMQQTSTILTSLIIRSITSTSKSDTILTHESPSSSIVKVIKPSSKIVINGKNYTVFNVTEIDQFSPLLSIDNQAKEIILLSTAFATMLLCTCFLIFILWFCCFTAYKDRKSRINTKQMARSIKETETSLSKYGGITSALKQSASSNNKKSDNELLHVKDDTEYLVLKTLPKNQKENKSTNIDETELIRTQKTRLISSKLLESKLTANPTEAPNNDAPVTIAYQPYDILSSTQQVGLSNKKLFKEHLKNKLQKQQKQNSAVNEAFVSEYENYSEANESQQTEDQQNIPSSIDANNKTVYYTFNYMKPPNYSSSANYNKVKMKKSASGTTRRSDHCFATSLPPQTSFDPFQVNSLNRVLHARTNKDFDGKISKNMSLRNHQKLTREQIEKEFYEYTLDCRRRLKQIFLESPSTSTPQSLCSSPDFIREPTFNTTSTPKQVLNNFRLFKPSSRHQNKISPPSVTKLGRAATRSCERDNLRDLNVASVRRKTETEQIWHI